MDNDDLNDDDGDDYNDNEGGDYNDDDYYMRVVMMMKVMDGAVTYTRQRWLQRKIDQNIAILQ